jgi:hypothetical protein
MPISISPLSLEDIAGAVDAIQKAFSEDPYNLWVYNDRSKVSDRLMVRLLALRIVLCTQNIPLTAVETMLSMPWIRQTEAEAVHSLRVVLRGVLTDSIWLSAEFESKSSLSGNPMSMVGGLRGIAILS